MTNENYIQWLETMIVGCDDLGGMEREKAIYQNCLKKARNLGQNLPIQRVSDTVYDPDWEMIQTAPHGIQYKHKKTGKTKWE